MSNGLVNYGILKPELATSFATGFEEARERNKLREQQERANKLAEIQLRAAQRGEQDVLAEREAYRRAGTITNLPQELMAAGLGKQAIAAEETLRKRQSEILQKKKAEEEMGQLLLRRVYTEGTRQSVNDAIAEAEKLGIQVGPIKNLFDRTPDSDIARVAFSLAEGPKSLEQSTVQLPGGGTSIQPKYVVGAQPAAQAAPVMPSMPAGVPGQTAPTRATGLNALALPAPGAATFAGVPAIQGAIAMPGGGRYFPPAMTPQQQEAAARDQQRVALEQRRVELAEKEQARKEAGLAEPLSVKDRQKREATYPQATSAMKGFEAKSDNFVKDLQMLRDHPGLGEITGILAGRIGTALTDQGRAALALYNKVTAKGGFQALQDMREASKTGGALGNVSNQEGRQLVASFAAIDRTQNAKDVQAALNAAISDVEGAKARMREAYDATYEYRTQNAPAAKETAKETRKPQLSARDQQALDWANANPGDPRAAQIKQHLGVR